MAFASTSRSRAALLMLGIGLIGAGNVGVPVAHAIGINAKLGALPRSASHQSEWRESVLYSFPGTIGDGFTPLAGVIADVQGALYGTAEFGGTDLNNPGGIVYKLTPPASGKTSWTESLLHSFVYEIGDGYYPTASLVAGSQAFYGTTPDGGSFTTNCGQGYTGCGSVFQLTAVPGHPGLTETVLHGFEGSIPGASFLDGAHPAAGLIEDLSGALYGTTVDGGTSSNCSINLQPPRGQPPLIGCGTVYKLTPPASGHTAWNETVLYSFTNVNGDGSSPLSSLLAGSKGQLYGTTFSGGNLNCSGGAGCGNVFELDPPTRGHSSWSEKVLFEFSGVDGAGPEASLIADSTGTLYGTTTYGGSVACPYGLGCGTVFKLTPPKRGQNSWTESVVHSFGGVNSDGHFPKASLIHDANGAVYGTTIAGGGGSCGGGNGNGCGVIFELTPPKDANAAWTESILHDFTGAAGDGAFPAAGLIENRGVLFGTTSGGGFFSRGTVFALYGINSGLCQPHVVHCNRPY